MNGQVESNQQQEDAGEEAQVPATTTPTAADVDTAAQDTAGVEAGGNICMEDAVAVAEQQQAEEEAAALEAAAAAQAGPDNPMADMLAAKHGKGNKVIRPPPPAAAQQQRALVDPQQAARQLLLRLLTRRAAAYVELGQLAEAEGDLREALR
jgi:hypothetical protein